MYHKWIDPRMIIELGVPLLRHINFSWGNSLIVAYSYTKSLLKLLYSGYIV